MRENQVQEMLAQYIRLQYPEALFHSDFGSGAKLTPGQAMRQKRQNGGRRAWPDLFVAEPFIEAAVPASYGIGGGHKNVTYHGLFIELKRDGTRLRKTNGEWATRHIAEQAKTLLELRQRGYAADFAVGFDSAKKLVDDYLGEKYRYVKNRNNWD